MLQSAKKRPSTAERTLAPIRARAKNGVKKLKTILASYEAVVRAVYMLQYRIHSLAQTHRASKAQFHAVRNQLIAHSVLAFRRGRKYLRTAKIYRPDIEALRLGSSRDPRVVEDDAILASSQRTETAFKFIHMSRKTQGLEQMFTLANKEGIPLQNPSAAAAVLHDPNFFSPEYVRRVHDDKDFRKLTLSQQIRTMREDHAAARAREATAKKAASERRQDARQRKPPGKHVDPKEQHAPKKQGPRKSEQREVPKNTQHS